MENNLREIIRKADESLANYSNPDVAEFVRKHPDYVRKNWFAQPTERDIEREEETLP